MNGGFNHSLTIHKNGQMLMFYLHKNELNH